jgi:predicted Zn-dependent peptidase
MHSSLLWKKQAFSNGLRVLTYPKPSALTAQLAVAIEYGANDDENEQAGSAHFLEHLVPGGSPARIDRSREFERLGGSANFFTNPEYTLCVVDVPPNKIPEASSNLSSLLFDDCFEEDQFRVEQKIILHELAEVEDDPRQRITEMLMQCLYKHHPIRRPTGGYRKTVRHLSLSDLTQIHSQRYAPQNMILILSGKFSKADLDAATNCFSCSGKQKTQRKKLHGPETGPPKGRILKNKAGLSQTYLSLGARTIPSNHADVAALDLLNVVLGVGASSRLFIELREKRALAYSIGSSQTDGLDFGYFSVDCALKKKHTEEASALIRQEFANFRNKEVPEAELSKGKDMILGDIFRGMDDAEIRPEILAVMEMRFGKEDSLIDYIDRVKNVTPAHIIAAANKYLSEENIALAILAPKI